MPLHAVFLNHKFTTILVPSLAVFGVGCADWDNPASLSELTPSVAFEIEAAVPETFEETAVTVRIMDDGRPMLMREAFLEFEPADGGDPVSIEMEEHEGSWEAHVTFYAAGEHQLRFRGTPIRNHLSGEWGDQEVNVVRRNLIVGAYWVELAVNPAPVLEHTQAHIEFFVYDLATGGTRGAVVASGVPVLAELHDPTGGVAALGVLEESPGEYEVEAEFEDAGEYRLHVNVGQGGVEGEFHIPVLAPVADQPEDNEDDGGGHDD